MKNGRFSGSRISNAVRLTTAGSTSTWPKSGLIVAATVSPDSGRNFASTPTLAPIVVRFASAPVGDSSTVTWLAA